MKRMIDWFLSWFANARHARQVAAVARRLDTLGNERQRVEQTIDRQTARLQQMQSDLATARSTIQQYDETTKELRAELRVAALEIETMAASHSKFLKRYDAETAIEVRREVAARPYQEDRVME